MEKESKLFSGKEKKRGGRFARINMMELRLDCACLSTKQETAGIIFPASV